MRRGGTITFMYEYESRKSAEHLLCDPPASDADEYVVVQLEVEATIEDWHPQVNPDLNQPGCPAEGGAVTDLTVRLPDGTELNPIPDELYEQLCDKVIEEHVT